MHKNNLVLDFQIRKLYQPELYPGAKSHQLFQSYFKRTSQTLSSICTVGFEPNPAHTKRLEGILEIYLPCHLNWHTKFVMHAKLVWSLNPKWFENYQNSRILCQDCKPVNFVKIFWVFKHCGLCLSGHVIILPYVWCFRSWSCVQSMRLESLDFARNGCRWFWRHLQLFQRQWFRESGMGRNHYW